jgi:hypothetical protein
MVPYFDSSSLDEFADDRKVLVLNHRDCVVTRSTLNARKAQLT